MREIIAELSAPDEEHPDTWLTHGASGWLLRLEEGRHAYLEDSDCETVSHMRDVSAEHALQLWLRFSTGGPDAVANEPWVCGPRYVSPEELAARKEKAGQALLHVDRQFYDQLGGEFLDATCKVENCARGAHSIQCSVPGSSF
jgi:hypothetical protein